MSKNANAYRAASSIAEQAIWKANIGNRTTLRIEICIISFATASKVLRVQESWNTWDLHKNVLINQQFCNYTLSVHLK